MNNSTILSVDNICKKYCTDLHKSLRYGVGEMFFDFFGIGAQDESLRPHEFWALKNVSFEIKKGESIGLLGRNGSGKSTLLKILNGSLKPTSGRAEIHGKIQLLSLGVGFNPLLSGRENIAIACSLYGIDKKTVQEKYEQILEFTELGDFIEAPVKTYSSGMYSRLGFGIAIHTEPDILLVDEALAVGDLPFVSKCLRKIHEFKAKGGSLVLVSHSGYVVRQNCTKAIWLDRGNIRMSGEVNEVCTEYEMHLSRSSIQETVISGGDAQYHEDIKHVSVECERKVNSGDPFKISILVRATREIEEGRVSVTVVDSNNTNVFFALPEKTIHPKGINQGETCWVFEYSRLPLMRGIYRINVVIYDCDYENQYATIYGAAEFEVMLKKSYPTAGILLIEPIITKK